MASAAQVKNSQSPAQRHIRHADGSRPRVLYAEDQPSARVVTTAMLQRMGLDVCAVEDGEHAVRAAETATFDVILLDIEMPVMDGVSAAREIRALGGAHATTPILALSAFLADSTEQSHWRGAFDHALPKPANGNELDQAIREALKTQARMKAGAPAEGIAVSMSEASSLRESLREALPAGTWKQVNRLAHKEARHYMNAAKLAAEMGDDETLRRCHHGLKSLALSFGHDQLATALKQDGFNGDEIGLLVENWPG